MEFNHYPPDCHLNHARIFKVKTENWGIWLVSYTPIFGFLSYNFTLLLRCGIQWHRKFSFFFALFYFLLKMIKHWIWKKIKKNLLKIWIFFGWWINEKPKNMKWMYNGDAKHQMRIKQCKKRSMETFTTDSITVQVHK